MNPYAALDYDSDEDEDPNANPEIAAIGAGTMAKNLRSTSELRPMKYREAIKTEDKEEWARATKDEYNRLVKNDVFKVVPIKDVPEGTHIMTNTWACKKKANGTFRARLNMKGFEQIPGEHYEPDWISAPVARDVAIRLMLCLMLMSGMYAHLVDVQGAFLLGQFANSEQIYSYVPEGWEALLPEHVVLLLLRTVCGLKQAANCFYNLLSSTMSSLGFNKSRADSAMFYKWHPVHSLLVWLSWVDDLAGFGEKDAVLEEVSGMSKKFAVDDVGEMTEYLGCVLKFNRENTDKEHPSVTLIQPTLVQRFEDEFSPLQTNMTTPVAQRTRLRRPKEGEAVSEVCQKSYRTIVGILIHITRWSGPDIMNAVREATKHMQASTPAHKRYVNVLIGFLTRSKNRGWKLMPTRKWDKRDKAFKFKIKGKSDSDYATCPDTRRSVTGYMIWFEGALIAVRSVMQKIAALSSAEAELIALVLCLQEMIF